MAVPDRVTVGVRDVTLDPVSKDTITKPFDILHAVPPQKAPDFIRISPLADAAGWIDVDPATLRHKRYANVYGLGDGTNTPNAMTAAAARTVQLLAPASLVGYLIASAQIS